MTTHHVLGISGGKDSAALAIYMRENFPELDIKYFFTFSQIEVFRNPQFPITFAREQEAHRRAGTSAAGARAAQ